MTCPHCGKPLMGVHTCSPQQPRIPETIQHKLFALVGAGRELGNTDAVRDDDGKAYLEATNVVEWLLGEAREAILAALHHEHEANQAERDVFSKVATKLGLAPAGGAWSITEILPALDRALHEARQQARREALREAKELQKSEPPIGEDGNPLPGWLPSRSDNRAFPWNAAGVLLGEMDADEGRSQPLAEAMRDIRLAIEKQESMDYIRGFNAGRALPLDQERPTNDDT